MPPKTSWKERHKKKMNLSENEKTILKSINTSKFDRIFRDSKGDLFLRYSKNYIRLIRDCYNFEVFSDLFLSIKSGEEYKISDLLEE